MKALTISQPFASLIIAGEKWVENRQWGTNYRGRLAIHAGKGKQYLTAKELAEYPSGCVLGTARVLACMPLDSMHQMGHLQRIQRTDLTIGDVLAHEHTEGPWCWILTDVRRYREPVPCRGAQGLWDWLEPDLVELEPP